jgi:hypothetical protein
VSNPVSKEQRMANAMSAARDHEQSGDLPGALQRYQLAYRYAGKDRRPAVQEATERVMAASRPQAARVEALARSGYLDQPSGQHARREGRSR